MNIALYFGSFNPIHIGHLIIANYILNETPNDKLWFVVSPQNPFKNKKDLLNQNQRLHLVRLAIDDNYKMQASDIEFNLPQPNYTIDTLIHLKEKFPDYKFSIIMGSDNLLHFKEWKNYEQILNHYKIYVYQREKMITSPIDHPNIQILNFPLLDISASYIRQCIKTNRSIHYIVPDIVRVEIEKSNYYKS